MDGSPQQYFARQLSPLVGYSRSCCFRRLSATRDLVAFTACRLLAITQGDPMAGYVQSVPHSLQHLGNNDYLLDSDNVGAIEHLTRNGSDVNKSLNTLLNWLSTSYPELSESNETSLILTKIHPHRIPSGSIF